MWLGTLGPGKARQGEFLREAERWRRYIEALAHLSSLNEPESNRVQDFPVATEQKQRDEVYMNLESYNRSISIPSQLEELSIASDE
jgi:hypothetical protein